MKYEDDDMMKYRKKTKKKTAPKADHKHDFECVIISSDTIGLPRRSLGERCTICGKIKPLYNFFSERDDMGFHRLLTPEEVDAKFPKMPRVTEKKYGVFEDIPGEKYGKHEVDIDDMLH